MDHVTNDIGSKSNNTSSDFKMKSSEPNNFLAKATHMAEEKSEQLVSRVASGGASALKGTQDYFRTNPMKGAAFAAAAGLVAGSLVTWSMINKRP